MCVLSAPVVNATVTSASLSYLLPAINACSAKRSKKMYKVNEYIYIFSFANPTTNKGTEFTTVC